MALEEWIIKGKKESVQVLIDMAEQKGYVLKSKVEKGNMIEVTYVKRKKKRVAS